MSTKNQCTIDVICLEETEIAAVEEEISSHVYTDCEQAKATLIRSHSVNSHPNSYEHLMIPLKCLSQTTETLTQLLGQILNITSKTFATDFLRLLSLTALTSHVWMFGSCQGSWASSNHGFPPQTHHMITVIHSKPALFTIRYKISLNQILYLSIQLQFLKMYIFCHSAVVSSTKDVMVGKGFVFTVAIDEI